MTRTMMQSTYDVLRHLEVHGPRTRDEVKKSFADRPTGEAVKALDRLNFCGYVSADDTTKPITYTLTGKARKLLAAPFKPGKGNSVPRTPRALPLKPARQNMPKPSVRAYHSDELAPSLRPRAMDAFECPSRVGDTLRYRDGRVTDLAGNPITNP